VTLFTKKNFVADFLLAKCDFTPKTAVLRFKPLLGSLGAMYDDHLKLIGKRVVDFLLVLTELFAGDWNLQEWKMTDNVAGVEFAGLENDMTGK